ncbi:hypothetical protein SCA6_002755 [Theobroma cacao]
MKRKSLIIFGLLAHQRASRNHLAPPRGEMPFQHERHSDNIASTIGNFNLWCLYFHAQFYWKESKKKHVPHYGRLSCIIAQK